jgi:hypothetical protein
MPSVDFVEACFTGRTDFVFVRYSVTEQKSLSLPRQRKGNHVRERLCDICTDPFNITERGTYNYHCTSKG